MDKVEKISKWIIKIPMAIPMAILLMLSWPIPLSWRLADELEDMEHTRDLLPLPIAVGVLLTIANLWIMFLIFGWLIS